MKRTEIIAAVFALVTLSGCAHEARLPPKAIQLNDDGAAALAAGDLTTAEARAAAALEYNPKFTEAWVNLGLVQLRRGNFEEARRDLQRAVKLNPDLPTPHHGLGYLAEVEGKSRDAEEHYADALRVDPGFAPARVNLGRLLFQRGAVDDAREHFLRLTELAPESLEGWLGLSECLLKLDRVKEAANELALARKRFGDGVGPLNVLRARLLLDDGNSDAAIALLIPATADLDRSHASNAWAWLAAARWESNDIRGAASAANESLRLQETNAVALEVVARIQSGKLAHAHH